MILDHIENAAVYCKLNPGIRKALNYLSQTDFTKTEPGKYPIKGEDIFALVSEYETREYNPGRWENHREYIDVQYMALGKERLGYTRVNTCMPGEPYNPDKDIAFWSGEGILLEMEEHMFAILYPQDAHQPGIQWGNTKAVKKVVVKVRNYQTEE
mgnify:CR=1 FL=1